MEKQLITHIEEVLTMHWQTPVKVHGFSSVAGGDINEAFVTDSDQGPFFVKLNSSSHAAMFEREYYGLQLLHSAKALKVPMPILYGTYGRHTYLLMEFLPVANATPQSVSLLAEGLASLHRHTHEEFGLQDDNFIGTLVQQNGWNVSWSAFYVQNRIVPLVSELVTMNRFDRKEQVMAEALSGRIGSIFPDEAPALLHGDLWSGNYMITTGGQPAIYDPAVYYGHREMDIAMTLLFGGFDSAFYYRYQEVFPLAPGWRERVRLCQLYPVLVHAVLFGGHYVRQAAGILEEYS